MSRVKYGTTITKRLVCDECNDGSCEVLLHRKVVKSLQTQADFDAPKWVKDGQCIHQSFHDAKWRELPVADAPSGEPTNEGQQVPEGE